MLAGTSDARRLGFAPLWGTSVAMLAYSVQQSVTRLPQQVLLKSRLTKLALNLAGQTHALLPLPYLGGAQCRVQSCEAAFGARKVCLRIAHGLEAQTCCPVVRTMLGGIS